MTWAAKLKALFAPRDPDMEAYIAETKALAVGEIAKSEATVTSVMTRINQAKAAPPATTPLLSVAKSKPTRIKQCL